ncbi:NAD-dependent epimerase/dehydratase family protein [Ohtaekwangia sp.]|uniref:NAD-dependent epimerase/dehydratase family protein n=1 Tax=Ohtaekwangia sp. TaxID=2066019 RepID=UPI002FDCFE69
MNSIIEEDIESLIADFPDWEKFRNKTVLVSGASGFLPAYIVETLSYLNIKNVGLNVKIIALVRNGEKALARFSHLRQYKFLSIIEHDVCDVFETEQNIDFIIHAASQASPKYFNTDPVGTLNANVLGTINLVKLAYNKNVESFLFFSSSEVYGEVLENQIPIEEHTFGYLDPTQVRSCYAESKRMGENICISWFHQYGVKAKIVRPFHTYGPGMSLEDGRVFADFVGNVVNGRNIILKSDGSARRAFCYLKDATKAFLLVLLHGENGQAYNVGNPHEEYSIRELANLMVNIKPELGIKTEVTLDKDNMQVYAKSTVSRSAPNISKMKKLGWSPGISAAEGFRRTVLSFLD